MVDREYLAAALAQDLRTPITRMKLRCELLGEGQRQITAASRSFEVAHSKDLLWLEMMGQRLKHWSKARRLESTTVRTCHHFTQAQALGLINIPIGGHDDYVNDRSDVEMRKLIEINKYQEEEADA